ncbi:hypothetical protein VP01_6285g1 [Puccinia sorghi]|uniref:Tc1-like transposase DDE domain-containing protein n=1 Tax=Puccinia sorghi TaxID=27349 RepID=A0A0L6UGC7_9BASI|nr:hypothetical protein VP01_6285g1 [Puccinia sorghi]
MAVTQDTFNGCQWEDFLQADLIPLMKPHPNPNPILVCDTAKINKTAQIRSICDAAGIQIMYLHTVQSSDLRQ